jgi:tRNA/tmRNA/rRNA uracil-C5-methylase (TrmA/RlmC/RlmD family)
MIGQRVRVSPRGMAHGGRAIARHEGQAVFVAGALPGDIVEAVVVRKGRRHLEAVAESVLEPSPDRVAAPCPYFGSCGGCQWQTARYEAQLAWKKEVVSGQLLHLARLAPSVRSTLAVGPHYGYRNRIDLRVIDGQPALFKEGSHELVPIDNCLVAIPPIQRMFAEHGPLDSVERLTLRAGANTGESMALADDDFGRIHEVVAGSRFRISGRAFFQNNTGGAEALVKLVKEALDPQDGEVFIDAYAGGGLFSATVGEGCHVYAVESDPQAASDLIVNAKATVLTERFESCASLPTAWDVAVVDPPRAGLGRKGADRLLAGWPRAIAYVSCDPASFARDAALLVAGGYQLDWVQPVDMFPQTFHVEVVGRFLHP